MESYKKQPFKKHITLKKSRLVASKKQSFKEHPPKKQIYKNFSFCA